MGNFMCRHTNALDSGLYCSVYLTNPRVSDLASAIEGFSKFHTAKVGPFGRLSIGK